MNLLKSKIKELSNQRFFIGIFDKANFKTAYEIFYKIMYENILIVENCFYFINENNNNNNEQENILSFYSRFKNFILVNNSEKIQVFEDIDHLLNYPIKNNSNNSLLPNNYLEAVNSFSKVSKLYFFDTSFPTIMEFKREKINLIFQYSKFRVIFSYDKTNKEIILKTLKEFVSHRKNVENYSILNFDMENAKYFDEEQKVYLYFTRVAGVHFTNQNFENIFHFNMDNQDIIKINEFADDNHAKYQKMFEVDNNSLNSNSEINKKNYENKSNNKNSSSNNNINNPEKKFVTAKIVEKLDNINNNESGDIKHINNNIDNQKTNMIKANIKNQEKNKLEEDFVKGNNFNKEEEINKQIGTIIDQSKNQKLNSSNANSLEEDIIKHEAGVNKIKNLIIYFILYCIIYYFFYMRISKREESKYN